MKLELSPQIFEKKTQKTKFHEKPPIAIRVFKCGQTDRYDEANSRFSQKCEKRTTRRLTNCPAYEIYKGQPIIARQMVCTYSTHSPALKPLGQLPYRPLVLFLSLCRNIPQVRPRPLPSKSFPIHKLSLPSTL